MSRRWEAPRSPTTRRGLGRGFIDDSISLAAASHYGEEEEEGEEVSWRGRSPTRKPSIFTTAKTTKRTRSTPVRAPADPQPKLSVLYSTKLSNNNHNSMARARTSATVRASLSSSCDSTHCSSSGSPTAIITSAGKVKPHSKSSKACSPAAKRRANETAPCCKGNEKGNGRSNSSRAAVERTLSPSRPSVATTRETPIIPRKNDPSRLAVSPGRGPSQRVISPEITSRRPMSPSNSVWSSASFFSFFVSEDCHHTVDVEEEEEEEFPPPAQPSELRGGEHSPRQARTKEPSPARTESSADEAPVDGRGLFFYSAAARRSSRRGMQKKSNSTSPLRKRRLSKRNTGIFPSQAVRPRKITTGDSEMPGDVEESKPILLKTTSRKPTLTSAAANARSLSPVICRPFTLPAGDPFQPNQPEPQTGPEEERRTSQKDPRKRFFFRRIMGRSPERKPSRKAMSEIRMVYVNDRWYPPEELGYDDKKRSPLVDKKDKQKDNKPSSSSKKENPRDAIPKISPSEKKEPSVPTGIKKEEEEETPELLLEMPTQRSNSWTRRSTSGSKERRFASFFLKREPSLETDPLEGVVIDVSHRSDEKRPSKQQDVKAEGATEPTRKKSNLIKWSAKQQRLEEEMSEKREKRGPSQVPNVSSRNNNPKPKAASYNEENLFKKATSYNEENLFKTETKKKRRVLKRFDGDEETAADSMGNETHWIMNTFCLQPNFLGVGESLDDDDDIDDDDDYYYIDDDMESMESQSTSSTRTSFASISSYDRPTSGIKKSSRSKRMNKKKPRQEQQQYKKETYHHQFTLPPVNNNTPKVIPKSILKTKSNTSILSQNKEVMQPPETNHTVVKQQAETFQEPEVDMEQDEEEEVSGRSLEDPIEPTKSRSISSVSWASTLSTQPFHGPTNLNGDLHHGDGDDDGDDDTRHTDDQIFGQSGQVLVEFLDLVDRTFLAVGEPETSRKTA
ncbi:hypothetical protein ACA910_002286 [Epithemia clementina (nom. ined.)]